MTDLAQRLRDAAAQGQDIYGIHCDVEREAANEIDRLGEIRFRRWVLLEAIIVMMKNRDRNEYEQKLYDAIRAEVEPDRPMDFVLSDVLARVLETGKIPGRSA